MVRISESSTNPRKLYFFCENELCKFFEFWAPERYEFNLPICFVEEEIMDCFKELSEEVKQVNLRSVKAAKTMKMVVLGMFVAIVYLMSQ